MTQGPDTAIPVERTLDGALGFRVEEHREDFARGSFVVEDRVRQPMGLVHGGAFAALAETLASMATWMAVQPAGQVAVGLSNHTSFVRPALEGVVHAEATRRHRGRTTWLWEVEFTDDARRLCALSRVTMAVRDAPAAEGS